MANGFPWMILLQARKSKGQYTDPNAIADMMDTWTRQMGYPVVTVKRSPRDTLTLTQKHFLIYSKGEASDDFPSQYK